MNDNQFQIDIEAEQQLLSTSLTTKPSDIAVQETETIATSFALPESLSLSEQLQPTVELPKSVLLEPTKLENASTPTAEVSNVAAGLSVKFDAESSYNQLSKKVEEIEQGFDSNMNLSGDRWIPYPKAQNKFEEKPTTDPTNLIFEDRMDRFSTFPVWQ